MCWRPSLESELSQNVKICPGGLSYSPHFPKMMKYVLGHSLQPQLSQNDEICPGGLAYSPDFPKMMNYVLGA